MVQVLLAECQPRPDRRRPQRGRCAAESGIGRRPQVLCPQRGLHPEALGLAGMVRHVPILAMIQRPSDRACSTLRVSSGGLLVLSKFSTISSAGRCTVRPVVFGLHLVCLAKWLGRAGARGDMLLRCGRQERIPAARLAQPSALIAVATPSPYAGSARRQLSTWRCLTSALAFPSARAVFSNSACCWAGVCRRNSRPGWV